jgi:N-methylhydantoinase A
MGGTSADVSIVEGGDIVRSTEGEINDLPINTPLVDINTVGAGGGSIAWIDDASGLRVGPTSAGADPGPICYGRGGTEPTVTDANLVLGRIDPSGFLEGDVDDAVETARGRFTKVIAEPLGVSLEEAATSVVQIANAKMTREIRRVTVERGRDPSDFSLVAFGGAGPLQAAAIAKQMQMEALVVPRSPGVFSARGLLLADVRMDESRAYAGSDRNPKRITDELETLTETLEARFTAQGFNADAVSYTHQLDLRYEGQAYELTVPLPDGALDAAAVETTMGRFHAHHEQRYGYAMSAEPLELVTLRVAGTVETPTLSDPVVAADGPTVVGERPVYFDDRGYLETPIVDRRALAVGDELQGQVIVEEPGCTTLIPPEANGVISAVGNLRVTVPTDANM